MTLLLDTKVEADLDANARGLKALVVESAKQRAAAAETVAAVHFMTGTRCEGGHTEDGCVSFVVGFLVLWSIR